MAKTVKLHLEIAAPPEAIFKSLTIEEDMRVWLAEYAEISLDHNRYSFWGKYTVDNPTKAEGTHKILKFEKDRCLSFDWKLRGADSVVEIKLDPVGSATHLQLTHANVRQNQRGEAGLTDYWSQRLENLRSWQETGQVGNLCDYSLMPTDTVSASINIAKSRNEVFDALITPEILDRYFADGAKVDPVKGGSINFGWDFGGPIKILEIDRAERLSYSWQIGPEPETVVTWELEESGGGTKLTLVHSGFGENIEVSDYHSGWHNYLILVKSMLENGVAWKAPVIESVDWYDHSA